MVRKMGVRGFLGSGEVPKWQLLKMVDPLLIAISRKTIKDSTLSREHLF